MKATASRFVVDSRRLGTLALGAIAAFTLVCILVQLLRQDLDWIRTPLSFYLVGEYGLLLRAAYFVLGIGMVLLGVGYHRALVATARSRKPLLLFVIAGLSLAVTACAESTSTAVPLEALVHGVAAGMAFLCVTLAMMLQAVCMRGDAQWRHRFALAFVLALACFVAIWVLALWRDVPRGLTQKAVVALIVAWLALAASWLRSASRNATSLAAPAPAPETSQ